LIDSVTDDALIQAKDSFTATHKPHNFLNKKTRSQIKETIRLAKELGKRAEFWFKQEPSMDVRQYIEDKEGIVIVWSQETE
jgi:plasmid maintenance system antidote protein VapI